MKYSKEELSEAYKKLSPEIKEALLSIETAEIINNIGKKYNLHIDQIGELGTETGLIMLGLTHPTEFVSNLTKKLGVDRIVASQIAPDINDQVFLKIRESLKNTHKEPAKAESEETEPTHPTRDALLEAIQNPEGIKKKTETPRRQSSGEIPLVEIKNPYQPAKPEMGRDFPVVAPVPSQTFRDPTSDEKRSDLGTSTPDILTQKMTGEVSLPKVETTVMTTAKKIDPYKEQV